MDIKEITFPQDTAARKGWFRAASFSHPAKMSLGLQIYIIEHYTKVGDIILDCMAGSGGILVATAIGRSVICVELEEKFCEMMRQNWEKIKSQGPMLGYTMGEAVILQGDSRNLEGLLATHCIFSPPFGDQNRRAKGDLADKKNRIKTKKLPKLSEHSTLIAEYSQNPSNIGNLKYGEISTILTSPPYANRLSDKAQKDNDPQRMSYRQALDKISVACFSPPYSEGIGHTGKKDYPLYTEKSLHLRGSKRYGNPKDDNIGNLKSENYLSAMLQVYQGCHRVLRDGGLLILVVKSFIRNKKIVDLAADTIKLCEQCGFVLKERLARKLTQKSFWRILYERKYPSAPKIEHEDILILQKT